MPAPRINLSVSTAGSASPDLVWQRYLRTELWSSWSPQIRRVDPDGSRLTLGLTGVVHGLAGIGARFVVTGLDPAARSWSWQVRPVLCTRLGVPFTLDLDHTVDASAGQGTRTTLTISPALPAAGAVIGYLPWARLALRRLVRP